MPVSSMASASVQGQSISVLGGQSVRGCSITCDPELSLLQELRGVCFAPRERGGRRHDQGPSSHKSFSATYPARKVHIPPDLVVDGWPQRVRAARALISR